MTVSDVFSIGVNHGYIIQLLLAILIYGYKAKRRNHFLIRIIPGTLVYALSVICIPNIIAYFTPGFFSFIIFLLTLGYFFFLFEVDLSSLLFIGVSAQFTQNLSYNIESIFYWAFPDFFTDALWFVLSVTTNVIIYGICYFFFARKIDSGKNVTTIKTGFMFLFAIITAVFIYFMHFMLLQFDLNGYWIVHMPLAICSLYGLTSLYYFLYYSKEKEENKTLEEYSRLQALQFESSKKNMEVINYKAHDLKNQVLMMKQGQNDKFINEVIDVVNEYDTQVITGNSALDIILTEKRYLCIKEKIEFTIIADGSLLSFLSPGDITSIIGNALDNAIEYEKKIEDPSLRYISLKLFKKGGIICLHIENYFDGEYSLVDGLPKTTKSDQNMHGFGLKSIRYTVNKYEGNMNIAIEDKLFKLNIIFPLQ